ncbi:MAG: hypothetical protein WD273_08085 [Trueperaceae bacterium]
MAEHVTVNSYDTLDGPRLLMLTDYQGVRTAGTDTEPYTSGVTVLRDDTDAEEFVGVEADLPDFLLHREKLLALDLQRVDVPEYGLREAHPMVALLHIFEKLGHVKTAVA